jgi:hypothetical protein
MGPGVPGAGSPQCSDAAMPFRSPKPPEPDLFEFAASQRTAPSRQVDAKPATILPTNLQASVAMLSDSDLERLLKAAREEAARRRPRSQARQTSPSEDGRKALRPESSVGKNLSGEGEPCPRRLQSRSEAQRHRTPILGDFNVPAVLLANGGELFIFLDQLAQLLLEPLMFG